MCDHCRRTSNPNPPEKPWRILTVHDRGPGHFYRYQVTGENHYSLPGTSDFRISWSVPDLDDDRFDMSGAVPVNA